MTLRDLLARAIQHSETPIGAVYPPLGPFLARADAILAGLAADPETVEVLAAALRNIATCNCPTPTHGAACPRYVGMLPGPWRARAAALLRELTGEPHE